MMCLSLHFDVRPSTSTKSAKTTLKIFHPYLLFASVSLPSTANTPFSTSMILHDCRKNRTFFSISQTDNDNRPYRVICLRGLSRTTYQ